MIKLSFCQNDPPPPHRGGIPVLLQSKWKLLVVNAAISQDFEIRIQTVFQPAKTVKFNPSRFDLTNFAEILLHTIDKPGFY